MIGIDVGEPGDATSDDGEQGICPRNIVPLCCPRVGPPPDWALLADRRTRWFGNNKHWQCMICMRVVHLERLAAIVQPDQDGALTSPALRACPFHGPRALVLDFQERTWSLACVCGPIDDVATLRECCAHNASRPASGDLDLEAGSDVTILSSTDEAEVGDAVEEVAPESADITADSGDFGLLLAEFSELVNQFDDVGRMDIVEELEELADIARQFD